MTLLHPDDLNQDCVASNPPSTQRERDGEGKLVHPTHPTVRSRSSRHPINLPFWVSFVEQTRVEIWKESLLMVQLPRFCMLFPVAECPFSSSSILVDGRLKYVEASSSFFASACSGVLNTKWNKLPVKKTLVIFKLYYLHWIFFGFLQNWSSPMGLKQQ